MFSPVRHWRNKQPLTANPQRRIHRRRLHLECLEAHIAPAVFMVTSAADSGAGSLRQAIIDAAGNGVADTIGFNASLASSTLSLTSNDAITAFGPTALVINADNITIDGSAAPKMQISGVNAHRVFALTNTATLTLKSIWIANGRALGGNGGGVAAATAANGGGGGAGIGGAIYNFGGTLNLVQSTLSGNTAQGGNGGSGGPFINFYSGGGGGSVGGNGGNVVVTTSATAAGGAGVGGNGGDSVVGGGLGGPNQAGAQAAGGANGTLGGGGGGGTSFANPGGNGLAASTISGFGGGGGGASGNVAGAGGFGAGGGASASNAGGSNGGAGGFGGGGGGANLGTAGVGGFFGGSGGKGTGTGTGGGGGGGLGGAIFNNGGTVNIINSTLTGNVAVGGSAGTNSVSGSPATAGSAAGGAVFNRNGTLTILNSTISQNTGNNGGRGVYNLGDAGTATATINNTIIGQADNINTDFGGFAINAGVNTTSGVGNLIRSAFGFAGTVVSSADPQLGGLNFNGGPTPTMLPAAGSPVINLGNNAAAAALTTDQVGSAPRVFGGTIDIGALERQPPTILAGTTIIFGAPTSIRVGFGTPEPTFSTWGGSLPAGVTLSSIGVLSGTPTATGTFNFNIDASNGIGGVVTQAFTLTVNKADTTSSLFTSGSPTIAGQSVTFVATVSANAPSTATPTGLAYFFLDSFNNLLGSASLTGGQASLSTTAIPAGPHLIGVYFDYYGTNPNFNGSSNFIFHTVNQAATSVALIGSGSPSAFGENVAFTAAVSVTAPGGGTPTGTVTFFVDGTTFATVATSGGTAVLNTSALNAGGHNITATYNGDANNVASPVSNAVAQQVNQASTTVFLVGTGSPTNFGEYAAFLATISVDAPGGGTPDGLVLFLDNGAAVSYITLSNGQALLNTNNLSVGSHDIVAIYFGSANYTGNTSIAFTQQVNGLPTLGGVPSTATINELTNLSFTAADANATSPVFSLSGEPTGASIDPNTGEFNWTPTEDQGPGTFTFNVILDDVATHNSQSITVNVLEVNVAPVLAGVPATAITAPGSPLTFTATATDDDLINGLGNALNFSLVGAPAGASIDPDTGAFTWTPGDADQPGVYTFKVRVQDDGVPSKSDSKTIKVTVQPVALLVSGDLLIGGTAGADTIKVALSKDLANLVVKSGADIIGTLPVGSVTGRIIVHGLGGNDKITIDKKVSKPTDLYGEAGNDALTGGSSNDRLFGGNGNDKLTGGLGNDLLVGGAGKDTLSDAAGINVLMGGSGVDKLTGGTGEDLLVAGATAFDTDLTELMHVYDEWTSGDSYDNRIAHLFFGAAGGLNQGTVLTAATVLSDVEKDTLAGKKGLDWYIAGTGDVTSGFDASTETKTTI
jgi:Bacterial Ig-like domain (group 3)/Putative Ig domain